MSDSDACRIEDSVLSTRRCEEGSTENTILILKKLFAQIALRNRTIVFSQLLTSLLTFHYYILI